MWKTAAPRLRPTHSPSSTPRQHQIKRRAASSLGQPRSATARLGQPRPASAEMFWLTNHAGRVLRTGFEDAVVSKEAQDDTLAAALWLRSAELVGLPA